MCTKLLPALSGLAVILGGLNAQAHDGAMYVGQATYSASANLGGVGGGQSLPRVAAKPTPAAAAYPIVRRCDVVSGVRLTLYAHFLRQEKGAVFLIMQGVSYDCELLKWTPNSVTVDLPRLGLDCPRFAEIHIVLPDGRISKTFPVRVVPQPSILLHGESIPRHTPPVQNGTGRYLH